MWQQPLAKKFFLQAGGAHHKTFPAYGSERNNVVSQLHGPNWPASLSVEEELQNEKNVI
ncbi:MAG: hypothetical protein IME93_00665 [Proteobacteria bacterium]|nr:hypothetical protein [Pseudomonadota bacterium]